VEAENVEEEKKVPSRGMQDGAAVRVTNMERTARSTQPHLEQEDSGGPYSGEGEDWNE